MTNDGLDNLSGQITNIEGIICDLREALETLTSDAREAADRIEADTPDEPDDDPDAPEEEEYDSEEEYTAAMEKHDEIVFAADKIRERIERMEDFQGLLRDLENVNYPMDLPVDEYELEDAFAALNE